MATVASSFMSAHHDKYWRDVMSGEQPDRMNWFHCRKCGEAPDAPMLKKEVWELVSSNYHRGDHSRDLLCIGCVEKALGRQISRDDLSKCLGNTFALLLFERYCPHPSRDRLLDYRGT